LNLRGPCQLRATVDLCYWHERRSVMGVATAIGLNAAGQARWSAEHHLQKQQVTSTFIWGCRPTRGRADHTSIASRASRASISVALELNWL